jgi:hypothetical protein
MIKKNRLGQEEMVGFAVIVVIIGVILLVALGFFLRNPTESGVESYEIESFIQSSLQVTTDCESEIDFLSVQKLVSSCNNNDKCLDNRDSCEVLNSTLSNLVESSWQAGNGSAIKGYNLKVIIDEQTKLEIKKGNETSNYKSGFQGFARGGNSYEVSLDVYS